MIKQVMGKTKSLLKVNFFSLIGFELLYKLLVSVIGIPLLMGMFQFSMDISGYTYLDNENIVSYLMNPITIMMFVLIFIVMTFITMIDIHAVITCFHASYHNQKIKIGEMLSEGIRKSGSVFNRKNTLLIFFVLLIIPLTNAAAVSGFITSIHIPEFIMNFVFNNQVLFGLFIGVMVIFTLIAFRWGLSLHTFSLEGGTFKEARQRSMLLMKGKYIKTILYMFLWQLIIFVFALVLLVVLSLITILTIKILFSDVVGYPIALTIIYMLFIIVFGSVLYFSVPITFALLSAIYYVYEDISETNSIPYQSSQTKQKSSFSRKVIVGIVAILIIANGVSYLYMEYKDFTAIKEVARMPEITAHRGDSMNAPENSIPAFEKAIEAKVDWIELDVHQTKDEVVVVTHDADLKRIAGVNKNIYDITYKELLNYDVGSWFALEYKGLKVATLDEVIQLCKGKVKLNIELKPTGNEKNFEKNVIDIVNKNQFKEDSVLSSLSATSLKKVKEIDQSINTLYVMSVALGDITKLEFADNFSVEASFIHSDMISLVHGANKKLIAWTVNQEENITAMVKLGVDNIITDDPTTVSKVISENMTTHFVIDLVAPFFEEV